MHLHVSSPRAVSPHVQLEAARGDGDEGLDLVKLGRDGLGGTRHRSGGAEGS